MQYDIKRKEQSQPALLDGVTLLVMGFPAPLLGCRGVASPCRRRVILPPPAAPRHLCRLRTRRAIVEPSRRRRTRLAVVEPVSPFANPSGCRIRLVVESAWRSSNPALHRDLAVVVKPFRRYRNPRPVAESPCRAPWRCRWGWAVQERGGMGVRVELGWVFEPSSVVVDFVSSY